MPHHTSIGTHDFYRGEDNGTYLVCVHRKKKSGHRGGHTTADHPMTRPKIGRRLVKVLAGTVSAGFKIVKMKVWPPYHRIWVLWPPHDHQSWRPPHDHCRMTTLWPLHHRGNIVWPPYDQFSTNISNIFVCRSIIYIPILCNNCMHTHHVDQINTMLIY